VKQGGVAASPPPAPAPNNSKRLAEHRR
jgi:hypothetical protein